MTWLSMLRHIGGRYGVCLQYCRDLSSRHGEIGACSDTLIAPHIKDGQAALAAAVVETPETRPGMMHCDSPPRPACWPGPPPT